VLIRLTYLPDFPSRITCDPRVVASLCLAHLREMHLTFALPRSSPIEWACWKEEAEARWHETSLRSDGSWESWSLGIVWSRRGRGRHESCTQQTCDSRANDFNDVPIGATEAINRWTLFADDDRHGDVVRSTRLLRSFMDHKWYRGAEMSVSVGPREKRVP
jgi:hypothetical protein